MFLFIISFLLVFTSSYLLTSIISPKKNILGFIYLFLIAFAQIVLTFEILSLFTAIKQIWVLGANSLFLIISGYLWHKKSKPLWNLDYNDFRNRIINSLKLDKSLIWLSTGFFVLLIVSLILCILMPITNADAESYHVARSLFWVLKGNLNHFDIADIRNLCLPINSEILYSWVLLFVKSDAFLGVFSFVGYLLSLISIYNILGLLGYCTRKKLWVIFILSSFASVIVQISGTETDIIIAGLASSSVFLFWYALKNDEKIPVFMSALAYALALGTKTTSIIAIPAVGLLLMSICLYFKKYKPLAWFLGFGFINFLIFSAYNYILNFIHFSNFFGTTSFMVVSKNYYGVKGLIASFVKYIFMFFDFTGFRWAEYVNSVLTDLRGLVLSFLHLNYILDGLYTTPYNVNRLLLEPLMGAGVLGFLVYLPCLIWALIKPLFNLKSRKNWFIFAFALAFIVNILMISYLLAYMSFNVRFVMFFMVLSSPILVYSYLSPKNPLKYIIIVFSLFYMVCVSTHLWARPFFKMEKILSEHHSINYLRQMARCQNYEKMPQYSNSTCALVDRIKNNYSKDNKILAYLSTPDNVFLLKNLEFDGYKIDFSTMEDIQKINFNKYNMVISTNRGQTSTFIKDYEKRKNKCKIVGKKIVTSDGNTVPCLYVQNPKLKTAKSQEKFYPYQVICGMSKKFIQEKHLEMIGAVGVISPSFDKYDYYIIYRNTKLPFKFIKHTKNRI